jgi:hypothetical protein
VSTSAANDAANLARSATRPFVARDQPAGAGGTAGGTASTGNWRSRQRSIPPARGRMRRMPCFFS